MPINSLIGYFIKLSRSFVVLLMMKRILAILISIILLASGMQVTMDRHYCGGRLAGIKVSLTGKLASCGMKQTTPGCQDHPIVDKKCCEDKVSVYSISSNYYPEYFKLTHPASDRHILPVYADNFICDISYNRDLIKWVLPPGDNLSSGLTLSFICVFRI
jgi:hypothetical protein